MASIVHHVYAVAQQGLIIWVGIHKQACRYECMYADCTYITLQCNVMYVVRR